MFFYLVTILWFLLLTLMVFLILLDDSNIFEGASGDGVRHNIVETVSAQKSSFDDRYSIDITPKLKSTFKVILGLYKLTLQGTESKQTVKLVGSGTRQLFNTNQTETFTILQFFDINDTSNVTLSITAPPDNNQTWTCGKLTNCSSTSQCTISNYILKSDHPFVVKVLEPEIIIV